MKIQHLIKAKMHLLIHDHQHTKYMLFSRWCML